MKTLKRSSAFSERISEIEACRMLEITPPFKDENGKQRPGNRRKIRKLVKDEEIIAYVIGRNWLYNKESIEQYIICCEYSNLPLTHKALA